MSDLEFDLAIVSIIANAHHEAMNQLQLNVMQTIHQYKQERCRQKAEYENSKKLFEQQIRLQSLRQR